MATQASAYPRLSPSGRRVIAGDDVVVVDRTTDLGRGIGGQFRDETSALYARQPDGALMLWREGHLPTPVREQGFNVFVVAGERWIGWRAGEGLIWYDDVPWRGWHSPALSETRWAAILDIHPSKVLFAGRGDGRDGVRVAPSVERQVDGIFARDPVLRGDLLTWVEEDQRTHEMSVWGQDGHNGPIENITIPGNIRQGYVVPVEIFGERWALSHDDARVYLYPWYDPAHGHVVAYAPAHRPDGRQHPDGVVRIVYDAEHNVLVERLIDVRTEPRVDLRPVLTPPPERVPEGTLIDLLPFIVGDASTWPRDGSHYLHQTWDGRNLHLLKFGPMAEGSTFGDNWERWVLDGDQFYIREDRSQSGAGCYSIHPGYWFKRHMRVGESIDCSDAVLQRYDPKTCQVIDQHPLPYRLKLAEAWRNVAIGGILGVRDIVVCDSDPGGLHDTIERYWFARGAGLYQWRVTEQRDPSKAHTTSFTERGGPALTPTQGCWRRELVPWPPQEPDEEGMTKTELLGTEINRGFVLGAWTRFIHEVLMERDVIDGTTRTGLTDIVGTRGAVMYFFPIYYRSTMQAIDKLGHVPRNEAEWGHVSVAGFEAAKAVYLREQGGNPGEPSPTDPVNPGPPPVTGLDRIDGQLQIEPNGGFHVGGRPVLPTLCHYGDALSKWMRDRDHVLRNLDLIAGAGYHGIRYWTALDGDWWNGRHVGEPFQSDYWDQHRAFLLELTARGLVAQISQGSLTRDAVPDRTGFANRMADLLSDVGAEVCALFEGVNEARDTGEPDASRLAAFVRVFHDRLPQVLCALSAYTGTEDVAILDDFSRDPADLFVVHPYRGGGNHDKTRHLMSLRYEGKPHKRLGWNGEGPGPGTRVSAIDNRDAMTGDTMCGLAAMSFMMRMAYVYFCGVGVISDDGGSQTFDQMPGFFEVPKVRALVPADVMRYSGPIFHGGDTWRAQRTFAARGDVRADHVVHADGRQVVGIYGPGDLNVPQDKAFNTVVDHRFGSEFRLVAGRLS